MTSDSPTILDLIGRTPLLPLELRHHGAAYRLYCKAEFMNPTGSVKDRIAYYIIAQAERRGELRPGMTIVELSSGNTGIALAQVAAVKGYRLVILMPEHMSQERIRLLQSLGAEICLTPQADGFAGALARLQQILESEGAVYCPRQFENPDNPRAHYETTAPEIWEQMGGAVDAFVDGVGTGGTLMGVGRFLRERNPQVSLVAVEPSEAAGDERGLRGLRPQDSWYRRRLHPRADGHEPGGRRRGRRERPGGRDGQALEPRARPAGGDFRRGQRAGGAAHARPAGARQESGDAAPRPRRALLLDRPLSPLRMAPLTPLRDLRQHHAGGLPRLRPASADEFLE